MIKTNLILIHLGYSFIEVYAWISNVHYKNVMFDQSLLNTFSLRVRSWLVLTTWVMCGFSLLECLNRKIENNLN